MFVDNVLFRHGASVKSLWGDKPIAMLWRVSRNFGIPGRERNGGRGGGGGVGRKPAFVT